MDVTSGMDSTSPGPENVSELASLDLRTNVPHSARIYDYLLGGKDNFVVDREAAADITKDWVHLPISMRANRNFMCRATRYLAMRGFRQFLDIGSGLPTSPNLHEVAQEVAVESRIVYVDNDPIVLTQARALLTSTPEGKTAYVDADLRDPDAILQAPQVIDNIDLNQPIAVSLVAVLHFIVDERDAHSIAGRFMRPMPPGSALTLSFVTADSAPEEVNAGVAAYNARGIQQKARTKAEAERFFEGLELVEPGITLVNHWRPDDAAMAFDDAHVHMYGGVAIKP